MNAPPARWNAPMRCLLAAFLLATLPLSATAQPAHSYEVFPLGAGFRSPVADPAEPRVHVSRLEVKGDSGTFQAGVVGLGVDFGLVRRNGVSPDDGWQVSIFGSIDSLFNFDLPGDALGNTYQRVGFPPH